MKTEECVAVAGAMGGGIFGTVAYHLSESPFWTGVGATGGAVLFILGLFAIAQHAHKESPPPDFEI